MRTVTGQTEDSNNHELLRGFAHELNNLVGMVLGSAHVVQQRSNDPAFVERFAAEITRAAREMRTLADALRWMQPGVAREQQTSEYLSDVVSRVVAQSTLTSDIQDTPQVRVSEHTAAMVAATLTGWLSFVDEDSGVSERHVSLRVRPAGGVELRVWDNGDALNDRELKEGLTPFARLDRRPKPGLRLHLFERLAQTLGGTTVLRNRANSGVEICVTGVVSGDADALYSKFPVYVQVADRQVSRLVRYALSRRGYPVAHEADDAALHVLDDAEEGVVVRDTNGRDVTVSAPFTAAQLLAALESIDAE